MSLLTIGTIFNEVRDHVIYLISCITLGPCNEGANYVYVQPIHMSRNAMNAYSLTIVTYRIHGLSP